MWRSSFAATISCRCRTTLLPRAFSSPSASFGSWSMGYNFDRRKINFRQLSTRNDFDLEAVCSAHMEVPEQEFVLGCSFLHQIALGTAPALLEQKFPQLEALVNFRDYDRRTPLHIAASEGHYELCEYLLEMGAQINRSDRWGGAPLDDAIRHRNADVVQLLKDRGGKFGSPFQSTCFITAASEGDLQEVQALMEYGNVDVNKGDYDSRTALHLAAGEGRTAMVEFLCQNGANVNAADRWGNRPLDDATTNQHEACIEILQKYGASSGAKTAPMEEEALLDLMHQYGKIRDGVLSMDWHDVKDLLEGIGEDSSDEVVLKLFEVADMKGNGVIDTEEFLTHSDTFLGGRPARIILVVGGPGSGKGRLCERLVKECGVVHLSSGDLLRQEVAKGTALGKQVEGIMKSGGLVSSALMVTLMKARMKDHPGKRILLDGFPRSQENARDLVTLCGKPELALHITCDDTVLLERIMLRGKSGARSDDNFHTAIERIRTYHKYGSYTLDFLRDEHVPVVYLDGEQSAEGVWNQLCAIGRLMRSPVKLAAGSGSRNGKSTEILPGNPSTGKRVFSTSIERPPDSEVHAALHDGGVDLCFSGEDNPTHFHASWLWSVDPKFVHPTSGQRLRSLSSFFRHRIASVQIRTTLPSSKSAFPRPPPGCLHSTGSVYHQTGTGQTHDDSQSRVVLNVSWEVQNGQSYESVYDVEWLQSRRYDQNALQKRRQASEITSSTAAISQKSGLVEIDYNSLSLNPEETRFELLDTIFRHGTVLVRGATPIVEDLESTVGGLALALAHRISHGQLYGDIFHVEHIPDAHNIAYTPISLPVHQDLAYYTSKPGLQLIHCVNAKGTVGGASLLVDAMAAATEFRSLAPDLYDVLLQCEATFVKQRGNADMVFRRPHIQEDSDGVITAVHWSPPFEGPLAIDASRVDDYFVAYAAFERMLNDFLPANELLLPLSPSLERQFVDYVKAYTVERQLVKGDILIFNNHRMLHGRRSFAVDTTDPENGRHLVGCYTDLDETINQYRLLRRQRLTTLGSPIYIPNPGNGSSSLL